MDRVPSCLALSPLSPLVPPRAHAEAAALLVQFCADITAEDRARTKGRLAAALGQPLEHRLLFLFRRRLLLLSRRHLY